LAGPGTTRFEIAIAGASHTGLALALAMRAMLGSGVRIALLDREPILQPAARKPDPRAFALSEGSRRLLAALGVWERLSPSPQPVRSIDITDSSLTHAVRPVLLHYDNRTADGAVATYIVEAEALRCAMAERVGAADSIECLPRATVSAFSDGGGGVRIELADGTALTSELLVAADGGSSRVRQTAGIKCVAWSTGQVGIVTTIVHEKPHAGRAVQNFLPGGPFAMLPLSGNRSCVTWSEERDAGRSIVEGDDARFRSELERRLDYRLGRIERIGPRALWPLEFRIARTLIGSRLALAGDAARTVHPIAGQGLNLALRDVAALAECVADAVRVGLSAGDVTALERYELWRRFDAASSAAVYAALNAVFSNDWTLARAARSAGLGLVDRAAGLKSLLVLEAAGLTGDLPRLMQGSAAISPAAVG
jgi:2-octaprenyl-6-methoxyphenol hydroxylase